MKKISLILSTLLTIGVMMSCNGNSKENSAASDNGKNNASAVIENIMTRVSIREFTDKPVSKDTLDLLVKAGMAAPSAMDKRPWEFIIVTDRAVLDSLNAVHKHANLKTATAAIIVCGNMKKAIEGVEEFWVQDCSAATENILLAAHAYGLGAVWCGVYPNKEVMPGVSRVLGTPEDIIPLNIITLGYPAENPQPKNKYDKSNIHYQKW